MPFNLTIPDSLPSSVMCQEAGNNFSVTYFLTAQMMPRDNELFADPDQLNSMLRTERQLNIRALPEERQQMKNTQAIVSKVGDLIKNTATCEVSMDKDTYVVGDPISVHVDLDNSKVSKKVKSFKFKLQRTVEIVSTDGNFSKTTEI